jgi:hypothetical protein
MTKDEALEAAYLAGFNASGEGYNGEYPFEHKGKNCTDDPIWCKDRDNELAAIKQARSAPVQKRPQNCGTGYCSCIECVMEPAPVQEKWGASAVMNPDYVAAQKEKSQQALDVMAENARELGLDYEPVPENFIDALKFDVAMRDAAPVQEPVGVFREDDDIGYVDLMPHQQIKLKDGDLVYTTPPAAPLPEPVAWMQPDEVHISLWKDDYHTIPLYNTPPAQPAPVQEPFGYLEIEDIESHSEYPHNCRSVNLWHEGGEGMVAIYTTPPAQPAVPDAFGTREGEHPQYIQGWNDCRAEMLSMRKRVKP